MVRVKCLSHKHKTMTKDGRESSPLSLDSSTLTPRPPSLLRNRLILKVPTSFSEFERSSKKQRL